MARVKMPIRRSGSDASAVDPAAALSVPKPTLLPGLEDAFARRDGETLAKLVEQRIAEVQALDAAGRHAQVPAQVREHLTFYGNIASFWRLKKRLPTPADFAGAALAEYVIPDDPDFDTLTIPPRQDRAGWRPGFRLKWRPGAETVTVTPILGTGQMQDPIELPIAVWDRDAGRKWWVAGGFELTGWHGFTQAASLAFARERLDGAKLWFTASYDRTSITVVTAWGARDSWSPRWYYTTPADLAQGRLNDGSGRPVPFVLPPDVAQRVLVQWDELLARTGGGEGTGEERGLLGDLGAWNPDGFIEVEGIWGNLNDRVRQKVWLNFSMRAGVVTVRYTAFKDETKPYMEQVPASAQTIISETNLREWVRNKNPNYRPLLPWTLYGAAEDFRAGIGEGLRLDDYEKFREAAERWYDKFLRSREKTRTRAVEKRGDAIPLGTYPLRWNVGSSNVVVPFTITAFPRDGIVEFVEQTTGLYADDAVPEVRRETRFKQKIQNLRTLRSLRMGDRWTPFFVNYSPTEKSWVNVSNYSPKGIPRGVGRYTPIGATLAENSRIPEGFFMNAEALNQLLNAFDAAAQKLDYGTPLDFPVKLVTSGQLPRDDGSVEQLTGGREYTVTFDGYARDKQPMFIVESTAKNAPKVRVPLRAFQEGGITWHGKLLPGTPRDPGGDVLGSQPVNTITAAEIRAWLATLHTPMHNVGRTARMLTALVDKAPGLFITVNNTLYTHFTLQELQKVLVAWDRLVEKGRVQVRGLGAAQEVGAWEKVLHADALYWDGYEGSQPQKVKALFGRAKYSPGITVRLVWGNEFDFLVGLTDTDTDYTDSQLFDIFRTVEVLRSRMSWGSEPTPKLHLRSRMGRDQLIFAREDAEAIDVWLDKQLEQGAISGGAISGLGAPPTVAQVAKKAMGAWQVNFEDFSSPLRAEWDVNLLALQGSDPDVQPQFEDDVASAAQVARRARTGEPMLVRAKGLDRDENWLDEQYIFVDRNGARALSERDADKLLHAWAKLQQTRPAVRYAFDNGDWNAVSIALDELMSTSGVQLGAVNPALLALLSLPGVPGVVFAGADLGAAERLPQTIKLFEIWEGNAVMFTDAQVRIGMGTDGEPHIWLWRTNRYTHNRNSATEAIEPEPLLDLSVFNFTNHATLYASFQSRRLDTREVQPWFIERADVDLIRAAVCKALNEKRITVPGWSRGNAPWCEPPTDTPHYRASEGLGAVAHSSGFHLDSTEYTVPLSAGEGPGSMDVSPTSVFSERGPAHTFLAFRVGRLDSSIIETLSSTPDRVRKDLLAGPVVTVWRSRWRQSPQEVLITLTEKARQEMLVWLDGLAEQGLAGLAGLEGPLADVRVTDYAPKPFEVWMRTGGDTKPPEKRWKKLGTVDLPLPYIGQTDYRGHWDVRSAETIINDALEPLLKKQLKGGPGAGIDFTVTGSTYQNSNSAFIVTLSGSAWRSAPGARSFTIRVMPPMNFIRNVKEDGSTFSIWGIPGMVAETGLVISSMALDEREAAENVEKRWTKYASDALYETPVDALGPEGRVAVDEALEAGLAGLTREEGLKRIWAPREDPRYFDIDASKRTKYQGMLQSGRFTWDDEKVTFTFYAAGKIRSIEAKWADIRKRTSGYLVPGGRDEYAGPIFRAMKQWERDAWNTMNEFGQPRRADEFIETQVSVLEALQRVVPEAWARVSNALGADGRRGFTLFFTGGRESVHRGWTSQYPPPPGQPTSDMFTKVYVFSNDTHHMAVMNVDAATGGVYFENGYALFVLPPEALQYVMVAWDARESGGKAPLRGESLTQ